MKHKCYMMVSRKLSQMTAPGCPLPFLLCCLEMGCGVGVPSGIMKSGMHRRDERAQSEVSLSHVVCGDTMAALGCSHLASDM